MLCRWRPQGPELIAAPGEPAPGASPYVFSGVGFAAGAGESGALIGAGLAAPGMPTQSAAYLLDDMLRLCLRGGSGAGAPEAGRR